jgi:DNA topoisomerase-1
MPGISRQRSGKGFAYTRANGARVRDEATLVRIAKLAIPPAWTDVWIATDTRAHIQATGRDARGRKQYRYHVEWHEAQGRQKYGRMESFAEALPGIRARVGRDLRRADTSREQVLALLVVLLEATYIRVGNQEYKRANGSYGLTTLEDRHVTISGSTITFSFRGKGGKQRRVSLKDRRLARLVKQCRDVRGQHLFQYVDARGRRRPVHSTDLNQYIAHVAGERFTAKDFRTWGATLLAAGLLDARGELLIGTPGKSAMLQDIVSVSGELGNTPAICRKSYIHPYVLKAYQDEELFRRWQRSRKGRRGAGLGEPEARLLRYLRVGGAR